MAKKIASAQTLKEALQSFDLKLFTKWLKKNNYPLYKSFKKENEKVQMGTMCKMICNRTDLLATECHKRARQWLKANDMKGGIF